MERNHADDLASRRAADAASPVRTSPQGVNIDELVSKLVRVEGSDLHLKVGVPPAIRVNGLLQPLEGYEPLRPEDTGEVLKQILPEKLAGEFEEEGEVDFSYEVRGLGRFRVNAFKQRN